MFKLIAVLALAVIISLFSFSLTSAAVPMTVFMGAENGSGQDGTATLTPVGIQTQVDINIAPGPAGVSQPVHIHQGQCPAVAGVVHVLSDVVDGRSSTLVSAPIEQLTTGALAINVHKSAPEIGISTSCGNIPAQ